MTSRTFMSSYPKRSIKDMIGYCEYTMKEERGERGKNGTGWSKRYKMADGMREVLLDILARQRRRGTCHQKS